MAYGLQINNGSGVRAIDSDYTGVYYAGKTAITAQQNVSVPNYDNDTIPPMVFLKLPTTTDEYAFVSSVKYEAPTSGVGSLGTFSLIHPTTNVVLVFLRSLDPSAGATDVPSRGVNQTICESVGGTFFNSSGGGCRLTGDIDLPTTTNNSILNVTFSNGVPDISSGTVIEGGGGWSVGTTSSLEAMTAGAGWNWVDITSTPTEAADNVRTIVVSTGLAQGWVVGIQGQFPSGVTAYFYGIGGFSSSQGQFGLEHRDSAGKLTFSSARPPPTVRGVHNMSFDDLTYSASTILIGTPSGGEDIRPFAQDSEASVSQGGLGETIDNNAGDTTFSYPLATTAVYSLPIMPSSYYHIVTSFGAGSSPGRSVTTWSYTAGLRFKTAGTNVTGLTYQSERGSSVNLGSAATCPASGSWEVDIHAPLWSITASTGSANGTNNTDFNRDICGAVVSRTTSGFFWDVNSDCVFIDTSVPDSLEF